MNGLTPAELLCTWELGLVRPPAERALAALAAAGAGAAIEDLATLPIGHRDARLRALREATFGPRYQALVSCPSCDEQLEFGFAAEDVRLAEGAGTTVAPATLSLGDFTLDIRMLDSTDLAAAARCPDVATARRVIALRSIDAARHGNISVTSDAIPDDLLPELSAHLERADPDADTTVEVTCSACGARWEAAFDIAAYLWTEIETEAVRLLRDVHCLARSYGWREADILALSPLRRRAYLELVQA
jgi:hypothetical protein